MRLKMLYTLALEMSDMEQPAATIDEDDPT